jgi:hypothetical protein
VPEKVLRKKVEFERASMTIKKVMMELIVVVIPLFLLSGDERVQPLQLNGPLYSKIRGNVLKPQLLESVEDVANLLGSQSASVIKQQMQFETHGVLVFQWSGSGHDSLVIKTVNDHMATFQYTRGRTRDLRQHVQAFALDKRIVWNVTDSDEQHE